MEITGKIKQIGQTNEYGTNGFKKRELVLETQEQYPQLLLIEFVQDKCAVLDKYQIGQDVQIGINLRGREWTNPEGEVKYFNSIQGWKIEVSNAATPTNKQEVAFEAIDAPKTEAADDLPF